MCLQLIKIKSQHNILTKSDTFKLIMEEIGTNLIVFFFYLHSKVLGTIFISYVYNNIIYSSFYLN
jgi:hypothetical protein